MDSRQILTKYWGFTTFRPLQEEIINAVLEGKDTLALLPTGGGKSLCYQIPALVKEGICVVVSPLIALMRDQVGRLNELGIRAIAVTSGMSAREVDIALDNCAYGNIKFLYLSPERLLSDIVRVRLGKMNVNLLAVDEAHCISHWGPDFRPAYLKIAEVRELLPNVPVLAVTGSATEAVKKDIAEKLLFPEGSKRFQASFERKSLSYVVRYEENKLGKLQQILERVKGSSIVYVRNRGKAQEIAEFLRRKGISAEHYHAGVHTKLRAARQERWLKGSTRVMVSTNAFGLGIDKADVRSVVHLDLPDNIEAYYQEAGRAGRDGKRSFAAILFNLSDKLNMEGRIGEHFPNYEEVLRVYEALGNYFRLAVGTGKGDTFDFNIVDFTRNFRLDVAKSLQALKLLEQQGLLVLSEAIFMPSRLRMLMDKGELYKFQVENRNLDPLIKFILRSYPGLFVDFAKINEAGIATHLKIGVEEVEKQLRYLDKLAILAYEKQKDLPQITYLAPRDNVKYLKLDREFIKERKELYDHQLRSMLYYALNRQRCRSRVILDYFGEEDNYRCGICDICLERNKLDMSELEYESVIDEIKTKLNAGVDRPDKLVRSIEHYKEQQVMDTLRWLMDSRQVIQADDNKLRWVD